MLITSEALMHLGFKRGLSDGIPIALGYFSVSFAFGLSAVSGGLSVLRAVLISMTNLTSAGQIAGLDIIIAHGPIIEMALTTLVINMRYFLMSISVSQKLDGSVGWLDRFLISFAMTDEIFAVSSSHSSVGRKYMYGLALLPWIGWSSGTLFGALCGSVLPASVMNALDVAIYGMFIAIIIPPSKKSAAVAGVVAASALLSCIFGALGFSGGFAIIVCALVSAGVFALLRPIESEVGAK